MDIKGRNMGTWDNMHACNDATGELARSKKNDSESELSTNHYNRHFHSLIIRIKNFFKKTK